MMIKEYLKNNVLICDGAMGTYYSELTGNDLFHCEFGNLDNRETIKKIHREYVESGAKLIRTNTFSANTLTLDISKSKLKEILVEGVNIAKEVIKDKEVFIGASIGPIREENLEDEEGYIIKEYKFIVDCFLENGVNIFIFETFSNTNYLKEISEYIKNKDNNSFILCQFAIKPDGFSRDGISVNRIVKNIKDNNFIDSYGFNCGSGPNFIYEILKGLDFKGDKVSAFPNAGYPMIINERTVYTNNPNYFSNKIADIKELGVSIIGGCCGTNPSYIKCISSLMNNKIEEPFKKENAIKKCNDVVEKDENSFCSKLNNNKFVIAIELSSPIDTDITKIIEGAKICKDNCIDLVTIPDSPMSKVRADSTIIASKIKREVGIETMPHICCRDKNTNAIRSTLLGAHIEGIRNVLAITGDPISDANKIETKSVFNLNSFKLIELIKDTNQQVFNGDDIYIGGALNLNVLNKQVEYNRMLKKINKGAKFFLTQPIYDDESIEFLKKIKKESDVKILAGILPIVTYRNAQFLNNELPGVKIPEKYINMFSPDMTKEEAEHVGINISIELGKKLKECCDGFYFITPFKRVGMIMKIIKGIK